MSGIPDGPSTTSTCISSSWSRETNDKVFNCSKFLHISKPIEWMMGFYGQKTQIPTLCPYKSRAYSSYLWALSLMSNLIDRALGGEYHLIVKE